MFRSLLNANNTVSIGRNKNTVCGPPVNKETTPNFLPFTNKTSNWSVQGWLTHISTAFIIIAFLIYQSTN